MTAVQDKFCIQVIRDESAGLWMVCGTIYGVMHYSIRHEVPAYNDQWGLTSLWFLFTSTINTMDYLLGCFVHELINSSSATVTPCQPT